jgi:regulator of sigma E protease
MLNFLTNAAAFVVALGVIIFVHEAGHLVVAKLFDTKVLAFSLGFGRRLFGFRRGETEYRVSLLPLGGYVKLGGEDVSEVTTDPREFLNKPRWQRFLIYLAGPVMNVILAIVLIAIVFMVGIEIPDLQEIPPVVGFVEAGSSGAAAGLAPGDTVLSANGKAIGRWQDLSFELMVSANRPVALEVDRAGQRLAVTVTPAPLPRYEIGDSAGLFPKLLPRITQVMPSGAAARAGFEIGDEIRAVDGRAIAGSREFVEAIESHAGREVQVDVLRAGQLVRLPVTPADQGGKGKIGVGVGVFQRYGPGRAVVESARYNWKVTRQTLQVLGKIFRREISARSALSGPLEIAALSGAAARSGLKNLLYLMGFISISVAVLNLLPIPVLDGGQMAMLTLEGGLRRDLPLRVKERVQQFGFILLMAVMLTVLYFDLSKLLPGGPR